MNVSLNVRVLLIITVFLVPFAAFGIFTLLLRAFGRFSAATKRSFKVDFDELETIRSNKEVRKALAYARDWDLFDIYAFWEICGDYSMAVFGLFVFNEFATKRQLKNTLNFSDETIVKFFYAVQASYRGEDEVPFHNALHALDTMQKYYCFLRNRKFNDFPLLEVYASFCGMSCHDCGHDSKNNDLHIQTKSHLSQKYGDCECPLEALHAEVGWELVNDILIPHVAQSDRHIFMYVFISVILGTDMSHHSQHIQMVQALPDDVTILKFGERVVLLSSLVHAADISNPARSMEDAEPWIEKVYMEFAEIGRQQRQLGVKVTMNCEENACVNAGQIGFIKKCVLPLYEALERLLPEEEDDAGSTAVAKAIEHMHDNLEIFERRQHEEMLMTCVNMHSSRVSLPSLHVPDTFMYITSAISTPESDSGSFDPENCPDFPTHSPPEKSPQFLAVPSNHPEFKIIISTFSSTPDSSSAGHIPSAPSSPPPEPSPSTEKFLNACFPDTPDGGSAFFAPMQNSPSASVIEIEHQMSFQI